MIEDLGLCWSVWPFLFIFLLGRMTGPFLTHETMGEASTWASVSALLIHPPYSSELLSVEMCGVVFLAGKHWYFWSPRGTKKDQILDFCELSFIIEPLIYAWPMEICGDSMPAELICGKQRPSSIRRVWHRNMMRWQIVQPCVSLLWTQHLKV